MFPIIRIIKLCFQAHVLNLLIGNKASNVSGKAVKLGGYQWKDGQHNVRKWKLWVVFHLKPSNSYFVSMKYIGFIPAEKGCPCSADGCHYLLLDCTYNCSLRWRLFLHRKSKNTWQFFFFFKFCCGEKSLPTMHVLCKKYGQNQSGIWNISIASAQIIGQLFDNLDLFLGDVVLVCFESNWIYIKETPRFTIQISKALLKHFHLNFSLLIFGQIGITLQTNSNHYITSAILRSCQRGQHIWYSG